MAVKHVVGTSVIVRAGDTDDAIPTIFPTDGIGWGISSSGEPHTPRQWIRDGPNTPTATISQQNN